MQERVFDLRIWVQILVATTVKLCKYKYCHCGVKSRGKGVSIHMPPIQIHTYIYYIYIYRHNYCLLHCSKLQFRIEDLEYINYIRQRHSAHIRVLHRCLPCLPHSANEIIIFAYKTPTRFCLLCGKFQFRRETKWNAQFYSHLIFFAHLKSNNNFTLV